MSNVSTIVNVSIVSSVSSVNNVIIVIKFMIEKKKLVKIYSFHVVLVWRKNILMYWHRPWVC